MSVVGERQTKGENRQWRAATAGGRLDGGRGGMAEGKARGETDVAGGDGQTRWRTVTWQAQHGATCCCHNAHGQLAPVRVKRVLKTFGGMLAAEPYEKKRRIYRNTFHGGDVNSGQRCLKQRNAAMNAPAAINAHERDVKPITFLLLKPPPPLLAGKGGGRSSRYRWRSAGHLNTV